MCDKKKSKIDEDGAIHGEGVNNPFEKTAPMGAGRPFDDMYRLKDLGAISGGVRGALAGGYIGGAALGGKLCNLMRGIDSYSKSIMLTHEYSTDNIVEGKVSRFGNKLNIEFDCSLEVDCSIMNREDLDELQTIAIKLGAFTSQFVKAVHRAHLDASAEAEGIKAAIKDMKVESGPTTDEINDLATFISSDDTLSAELVKAFRGVVDSEMSGMSYDDLDYISKAANDAMAKLKTSGDAEPKE